MDQRVIPAQSRARRPWAALEETLSLASRLVFDGSSLSGAFSISGGSRSPFWNSRIACPRFPIISGRRPGPKTSRTTTRTTSNSPMPMPNMGGEHRSTSDQPQRLVILWPDRLRQDTAPSTEPSTPLTARRLLQRRQALLPRSSRRGRGGPHPRTPGRDREQPHLRDGFSLGRRLSPFRAGPPP